jgi:hypothetical protein
VRHSPLSLLGFDASAPSRSLRSPAASSADWSGGPRAERLERFPRTRPEAHATPRARFRLVALRPRPKAPGPRPGSGRRRARRGKTRPLRPRRSSPRRSPRAAQQPARGNTRVPARILPRDQHRQLERLDEADAADLPQCRFRDDEIAAGGLSRSWRLSRVGVDRPTLSKERVFRTRAYRCCSIKRLPSACARFAASRSPSEACTIEPFIRMCQERAKASGSRSPASSARLRTTERMFSR